MWRAAAIAAPSVTRTSSSARLRSIGVPRSRGRVPISPRSYGARPAEPSGSELHDRGGGAADALEERRPERGVIGALDVGDVPEESARESIARTGGIDDLLDRCRGRLGDAS